MLDYFAPNDVTKEENRYQKEVRKGTNNPDTNNDVAFTQQELQTALKNFNPKKGADGITSDILLLAFNLFPMFFTMIHNKCLSEGCFPKQWKQSTIIPIVKPGKEQSREVSKCRPISLTDVGGRKLLEKLPINRQDSLSCFFQQLHE